VDDASAAVLQGARVTLTNIGTKALQTPTFPSKTRAAENQSNVTASFSCRLTNADRGAGGNRRSGAGAGL
jgi:hypothetical protein